MAKTAFFKAILKFCTTNKIFVPYIYKRQFKGFFHRTSVVAYNAPNFTVDLVTHDHIFISVGYVGSSMSFSKMFAAQKTRLQVEFVVNEVRHKSGK